MCSVYNNHKRNKKRKFINEENNYVPPDSYPPEAECNNNATESNHTRKRKRRKLFNVDSKTYFGDGNILSCHEMSTEASTASDSFNVMSSHVYKKNEHHSDHNSLCTFTGKKHKNHKKDRERNSTNGLGNRYAGQILNNPNNPCLDESLSDITIMNKHKDKGNNLVSSLDNLTDKDVDEITIIYEDQYSDGALFAGSLRKKHKKEKSNSTSVINNSNIREIHIGASFSAGTSKERPNNYKNVSSCSRAIKDANIAQIPNCYEYELPNCDDTISDALYKKKHQKNKDSNLINGSQNVDVDPLSNCHNILCLDEPVFDGHIKKKQRKYKENSLVTNSTDIHKDQYLDAPLPAATLKKKHKKPQSEEATHVFHKKKHKKHKDSNLTNGIGNGSDQIYINHNILHLNEPVFDGQWKEKYKKDNEKSFVATDNFDEKIHEVVDIYDEQHLDASISDGASKKKHKKHNITEINSSNSTSAARDTYSHIQNYNRKPCVSGSVFDAPPKKTHKKHKKGQDSSVINTINAFDNVNQNTNSYMFNNNKFCLTAPDNERTESDSYVYSSIEKGNEFNPIFITDFNDEITDEFHKNSFEVTQRVSKINERLRQSNHLVLDFTEDFLDFEVPPLHANECVRNLSKEQQNELLSQGVIEKTGKFTHDEDVIIMKNLEDFHKTYDILDTSELLGIGRLRTDPKILKFLKAKHFYVRLGKGLNDRSLSSIYKRARRLLHPNRSKNNFQETEVKSLKYLHKVVNRKWSYIADALERTEDNCTQAYRWHGKDISRGKWTTEEEEQLIAAIEKVTGSSDLSCGALKGISWDKVANHVPTRTFSQCRMYWAYHLAQKPGDLKQKWNKNSTVELVNILRKDWYVENASEIDWLKVYESFVDVAPSHVYVQRKWLYLRSRIAGFKTMSYKGIINALCKKYYVTPQETHSAPFSSFARNQSISHSLEYMKEFTEDARNKTNKDV